MVLAMSLKQSNSAEISPAVLKEAFKKIIHDIKNPLARVCTRTEMVLEDSTSNLSDYKETLIYGHETLEKTFQMMDIIADIFYADMGLLKKEEIILSQLIEEVLPVFEIPIEEKNITLIKNIANEGKMIGDPLFIKKMIVAMIDNSIKFNQHNGSIEIQINKKQDCLELVVDDHWDSFLPEEIPHIGERFFRGQLSKKINVEGFGLGITLVKSVVRAHAGAFRIEPRRCIVTFYPPR